MAFNSFNANRSDDWVISWKLASALTFFPVQWEQFRLSNFDASLGNPFLQDQNNCSSFQIYQLSISHFFPQALSSLSRNFHWESAGFHEPLCGRILLDKTPLNPYFKFKLKSELWSDRTSLESHSRPKSSLWLTDAVSLANQNNLNNSIKGCDWLILASFIGEQTYAGVLGSIAIYF